MLKVLVFLISSIIISSCNHSQVDRNENCDKKLANSYATNFSITICETDTFLYLLDPFNNQDTTFRFLINKQSRLQKLACLSTTHLPFLQTLSQIDKAVGVGFAEYLNNKELIELYESGTLKNITAGGKLDFEAVISQNPDALLVYYYGNEDYSAYSDAGIRVIPISEYAESHPLGRAEWIKVFGLLTGNFTKAEKEFSYIDSSYNSLISSVPVLEKPPLVFTGSFFKGKWSAPGGDSFIATFIHDAGAVYAFNDFKGRDNINLDFETILTKVAEADYFGKVLYKEGEITRDDFLEEQDRIKFLKSFQNSELFYCNSSNTDYFGSGIMQPHLLLQDLIQIFHPNIASYTEPIYFHPLKSEVEE